ncbi:hypothetical protein KI387_038320 [Taxus chinensis]|uniref:DEK-C domain-containing protein n=1 Tax=Taxus chinensis TaxID=29808 RepID=A0AA38FAS0_TAXCH|nr:hypothetical protein KI387_038320 [Taxus chinensis]
MLRMYVMDQQSKWEEYLYLVEFSYNNSFQSSIGMAPFQALYGRECRTPLSWDRLEDRVSLGPALLQDMEQSISCVGLDIIAGAGSGVGDGGAHSHPRSQDPGPSRVGVLRKLEFVIMDEILDDVVEFEMVLIKGSLILGANGRSFPRMRNKRQGIVISWSRNRKGNNGNGWKSGSKWLSSNGGRINDGSIKLRELENREMRSTNHRTGAQKIANMENEVGLGHLKRDRGAHGCPRLVSGHLVSFACFAFKLVMALVGGVENVPVPEEKESNDHSEVVKANGEVDDPMDGGHVPVDGGSVPNDAGHVPSAGSEVQAPTESPPAVIVRKRGRPSLKPKLNVDEETRVRKVVTPNKKVDATPRIQPTTPATSDRPVREKRSVKRFITASSEGASRDFVVDKGSGSGTALKDIPNVVYKLSRKSKGDHILKLLHTVIYGKRVKALHIKNNILQFSGFDPGENKNGEKVKEKLEKLHKENLANLCDVLDLQISKTTKKEELVAKLFEFLEIPHVMQNILPEEKEQNSKPRKRKRADSETPGRTLGEITEKRQQNFNGSSGEDDAKKEVDAGDNEADKQSKHEESEFGKKLEKLSTEKESLKEQHEDKDYEAKGKNSKKLAKKGSKRKADEEIIVKREDEKQGKQIHRTDRNEVGANVRKYKGETENKRTPTKSPKGNSKSTDKKTNSVNSGELGEREDVKINPKRKSGRKPSESKIKNPGDSSLDANDAFRKDQHRSDKSEATYGRKESKNQTDRVSEGKNKSWVKASVSDPTEEQLRFVIRELLHEVDFNTATLSDVVKRLGRHFDQDFTEKKAYIRILVQEELTKIAEDNDNDDVDNQDED